MYYQKKELWDIHKSINWPVIKNLVVATKSDDRLLDIWLQQPSLSSYMCIQLLSSEEPKKGFFNCV